MDVGFPMTIGTQDDWNSSSRPRVGTSNHRPLLDCLRAVHLRANTGTTRTHPSKNRRAAGEKHTEQRALYR